MNKKSIISTAIVIVVLALLAWPKLKPNAQQQGGAAAQQKKGGPIKVTTQVVKTQAIDHVVQTTGNVLATEEVVLYPEMQGRVVSILFTEGSTVQKGALLVKLNDADIQAQLKKALATQQLKLETEKRNKQLLQKGAISQEAYDIAYNELSSINADIDLLKEQLRKTEIRAPFAGKIGLRNISVGSVINSSTRIAALQNISEVKLEFSVPEKYASAVKVGTTVSFKVDGQSTPFNAKVYAIEPKVDDATRNVIMRAVCANPQQRLLPGAFATVDVQVGNNGDAIMVPTQAIIPILKGQKVFVMVGDSAVEHKVKTGVRQDKLIEVTEGLKAGDEVITDGVMYLKAGAKVRK
jgi:membrane fusion protein (multidrug efflux system)